MMKIFSILKSKAKVCLFALLVKDVIFISLIDPKGIILIMSLFQRDNVALIQLATWFFSSIHEYL